MKFGPLGRLLTNPWLYVCLVVAGVVASVHFAPVVTVLAVTGAVLALFLIWRFGAYRGLWYLVLLTIPLKEPLSFDIYGTTSVYITDIILVFLLVRALMTTGLRTLWSRSVSFRIELVIVLLSIASLYSATRFFWGITGLYRMVMQMSVYVVARTLVTDREEALRSVFFVCLSLLAPAVFGLYQAALPFGTELSDWGGLWTAWDALGNPIHRVFSTFNNPLNLSQYLSMGFALSLGLVAAMARPRQRVLLVCLAALAAFCNLYTYSAGGILATVVSTVVLVLFFRSGRLLVVALAALVVIALLAPPALLAKVERLLTGEALTAAARLVTYQQALEIIRDHPVFGLGWGAMSTSLEGAYRITRADAVAFTVENYFLQRAVALGLVGLGLFVGLWVRFIVNLRRLMRSSGGPRRPDPLAIAMAASAIAFFTHAMFMPASNVSTNSVLWFLFAVAGSLSDGSGTAGHLT